MHRNKPILHCRTAHLSLLTFLLVVRVSAQTSVVTQHNDNARTGQNTAEYTLTPANVTADKFGKLFSLPVDGYVYAQPLYLSNVTVNGKGTHNVVFVATEHDSVYAFDADTHSGATAAPLWQISMLDATHGAASGATVESATNVSTTDIVPEIGISATPVIDPNSGTIYVVSKSVENGYPVQRLHALDVASGAEKQGSPITIRASVAGYGNGSSGNVLQFDPKWANSRAGLLLQNGILYIAFGSHGDNGPWHGWIIGYDASTLRQTGAFCASPNGTGGGIWMAGGGLPGDVPDASGHPYGRLFAATGNGSFDAALPYTNTMNYSDDELRFDLSNGAPKIADAFTPYNQQQMNASDLDFGSGGTLLLPDQNSSGVQRLLIQVGKQGTIYVMNRDNLGGYHGNSNTIVQEIGGQISGLWSTPAYWNNAVYFWGKGDYLKAFSFYNGRLSNTPVGQSSEAYEFPGATPVISANGNTNGIVWTVRTDGFVYNRPAVLQAHDALNVANTLYSSDANPNRDYPGTAVKFSVPTVVNGKVYVPAQFQVTVYGLLNGQQGGGGGSNPPSGSGDPQAGIDFSLGFSDSPQFMSFNGSTDLDDSRLQLTTGGLFQAGSAFYKTAVDIRTFITDFAFQMSNAVADGITFTIQGNDPTALGASAGDLGYTGISKSVAVKFDLYNNSGEGGNSVGLFTNGTAPTIPASDLSSAGIDLHSGDTMTVHLDYDGTNLALKLTDGVTRATYSKQWTVNIPMIVGGNTAYAGFTAGTGGASMSAKIGNWTFKTVSRPQTGSNAGALAFYPVTPCRVADTRNSTGVLGGPALTAGGLRSFPVMSSTCGIPADAAAYSLNVTVVPHQSLQYLTLWPTGQPQPEVSTLNSLDGRVVANAAIVPAGSNGAISAYVTGSTDFILDVNGYFAPAGGQGNGNNPSIFVPATPCRAVDTRETNAALGGPLLAANTSRSFPIPSSSCSVPANVSAFSTNITAVPNGSLQYLTLWPTGQSQPEVSTLNSFSGGIVSNAAIVPSGTNGAVSMYVTGSTNVILDLNGYFVPLSNPSASTGMLIPVSPCRVADTRQTAGTFGGPILSAGSTRSFPIPSGSCGIPADAKAYVLNVTAIPSGTLQYLTTWPSGQSRPNVSTLNSTDGRVVANAAIVPAGANGAISVYVTDPSHVLLDISGYIAP